MHGSFVSDGRFAGYGRDYGRDEAEAKGQHKIWEHGGRSHRMRKTRVGKKRDQCIRCGTRNRRSKLPGVRSGLEWVNETESVKAKANVVVGFGSWVRIICFAQLILLSGVEKVLDGRPPASWKGVSKTLGRTRIPELPVSLGNSSKVSIGTAQRKGLVCMNAECRPPAVILSDLATFMMKERSWHNVVCGTEWERRSFRGRREGKKKVHDKISEAPGRFTRDTRAFTPGEDEFGRKGRALLTHLLLVTVNRRAGQGHLGHTW